MSIKICREDVEAFLEESAFQRYQSVHLPFGLRVPGRDCSDRVDVMLGEGVRGKSVLDVGTYYGLFPVEAMLRGAVRAIGVESDRGRYQIAKRICELHGDTYEIIFGKLEDIELQDRFDIVLFLNVLHHVSDPIAAVSKLASLCKGTLIIEFCLADHPSFLEHCYRSSAQSLLPKRRLAQVHSILLRLVAGKLPLMAVGNRENHRTFYFSEEAFYNLFVVHQKVFSSMRFVSSPMGRSRKIAFCTVAEQNAEEVW